MKVVGWFGSRYGGDEKVIRLLLEMLKRKYGDELMILVGDCVGVDEMVYKCCKELGIKVGVVKVWNNWVKLCYRCDENDVVEVVGKGIERLRDRLRMRSKRLVELVRELGGVMIGYRVDGKGSRLVMRLCKEMGVRCYVVDEVRKKVVRRC